MKYTKKLFKVPINANFASSFIKTANIQKRIKDEKDCGHYILRTEFWKMFGGDRIMYLRT